MDSLQNWPVLSRWCAEVPGAGGSLRAKLFVCVLVLLILQLPKYTDAWRASQVGRASRAPVSGAALKRAPGCWSVILSLWNRKGPTS